MLGDVNKLFVFKSLLTIPSNVLPVQLKQTFPRIIWIFIEGEGDGIESRLPCKFLKSFVCIVVGIWSEHTTINWVPVYCVYQICIFIMHQIWGLIRPLGREFFYLKVTLMLLIFFFIKDNNCELKTSASSKDFLRSHLIMHF